MCVCVCVCVGTHPLEVFGREMMLLSRGPLENSVQFHRPKLCHIPTPEPVTEAWEWDNTSFSTCSMSRTRCGMTFATARGLQRVGCGFQNGNLACYQGKGKGRLG